MKKLVILLMAVLLVFGNTPKVWATEPKPIVIVLDPGHDYTHGGARANGLGETAINLKIAQYCYEELRTYKNVRVYMTRYTSDCPYPEACGLSDGARKDNLSRVEFAKSVGADAYVALHLNSYPDSSVKGATVFIPNNNYRREVGQEGRQLGNAILQELLGLGLANQGLSTRLSEDGTRYADGSEADYYGVIKKAKDLNIPGIIVEHCFISSPSDAANYLSTEEKIKSLGVADATGIAKYYGLTKGGEGFVPPSLETFHTVKFMCDGKLIRTQYVRDGFAARTLDEEELEISNVKYHKSLENITSDTIIEVDFEEKPEEKPIPAPSPDKVPETESESDTQTEETETQVETETETRTETECVTQESTEYPTKPDTTETIGGTDHNRNGFPWGVMVGIVCFMAGAVIGGVGVWWYINKNKSKEE